MGNRIQIIAVVVGIVFFLSVLRCVQKRRFKPSYAVLWIFVSLFLISVPVLEPFYRWFAYNVVGINDARNIIYIFLLGFLLTYVFYLTSKVTRMSDQVQNLISFTAILQNQIEDEKRGRARG